MSLHAASSSYEKTKATNYPRKFGFLAGLRLPFQLILLLQSNTGSPQYKATTLGSRWVGKRSARDWGCEVDAEGKNRRSERPRPSLSTRHALRASRVMLGPSCCSTAIKTLINTELDCVLCIIVSYLVWIPYMYLN